MSDYKNIYGKFNNSELDSVLNVLDSNNNTDYNKKLEDLFCKTFKVKYAISCNSGTSGLHSALAALNLKKDDWTKLGKLCNEIPVQQGRHQGQKYEQFRKATNVELEEARIIVKTMVKQFFNYLQNSESH